VHFGLTEEQDLLQAMVREFLAKELPPPRLRKVFDEGTGFDGALWRGAAGIGLQGLLVPERYGGAGLELLDQALVFEVFGEGAMPGPFLSHALATLALLRGGSEEQKERWLPRLASGEAIASVAIGEAGEVWAPDTWKVGMEHGAVSGNKRLVEYAEGADLLVVGLRGGELALVESGASGLACAATAGVDRTRSLGEVRFEETPAELLPKGREAAPALLDAGCILLAADAFGAASKLIRLTVDYVLTREQFGTPIAQFQAVKHHLADLLTDTEPMRGLFWYAGHAFDHLPEQLPREAAFAKAHITDRAVDVGRGAVELHGGIGFTWECDVQFWVKRSMFDRAWLGTPRLHRERIASLGDW